MDNFTKIWISLVILTLFSFTLGWFELLSLSTLVLLFVTTLIKGTLIIDHFMGLKEIKGKYRIIPSAWLMITLTLIALAYYLPIK